MNSLRVSPSINSNYLDSAKYNNSVRHDVNKGPLLRPLATALRDGVVDNNLEGYKPFEFANVNVHIMNPFNSNGVNVAVNNGNNQVTEDSLVPLPILVALLKKILADNTQSANEILQQIMSQLGFVSKASSESSIKNSAEQQKTWETNQEKMIEATRNQSIWSIIFGFIKMVVGVALIALSAPATLAGGIGGALSCAAGAYCLADGLAQIVGGAKTAINPESVIDNPNCENQRLMSGGFMGLVITNEKALPIVNAIVCVITGAATFGAGAAASLPAVFGDAVSTLKMVTAVGEILNGATSVAGSGWLLALQASNNDNDNEAQNDWANGMSMGIMGLALHGIFSIPAVKKWMTDTFGEVAANIIESLVAMVSSIACMAALAKGSRVNLAEDTPLGQRFKDSCSEVVKGARASIKNTLEYLQNSSATQMLKDFFALLVKAFERIIDTPGKLLNKAKTNINDIIENLISALKGASMGKFLSGLKENTLVDVLLEITSVLNIVQSLYSVNLSAANVVKAEDAKNSEQAQADISLLNNILKYLTGAGEEVSSSVYGKLISMLQKYAQSLFETTQQAQQVYTSTVKSISDVTANRSRQAALR